MSVPPSPSSSTHTYSVPIDALAAAAERRKQQQPVETVSAAQLAEEHEKRQAFRRLVDGWYHLYVQFGRTHPIIVTLKNLYLGIHRGNSQEIAFASIKVHIHSSFPYRIILASFIFIHFIQTLSTIAENLLREPDNAKFQQFKPTNTTIKHRLVDPKGTLEYAIAVSD